jgi:hypothetical protein
MSFRPATTRLPLTFLPALAMAVGLASTASSQNAVTPAATPALPAAPPVANPLAAAAAKGCLPGGNGFLRARIRGALNLDLNGQNAELECDGAARPNGKGIRLSFAGPARSDGRRLRLVFGVTHAAEGNPGSALPTNLTVIFEGEKRMFATRGDDKCTVDKLEQERVGALGGDSRSYRVVGSGFCIEPANTLDASERIVVSSFDFAGRITYFK